MNLYHNRGPGMEHTSNLNNWEVKELKASLGYRGRSLSQKVKRKKKPIGYFGQYLFLQA